jgi:hypothetical protein
MLSKEFNFFKFHLVNNLLRSNLCRTASFPPKSLERLLSIFAYLIATPKIQPSSREMSCDRVPEVAGQATNSSVTS